jgi:hypothetical protein
LRDFFGLAHSVFNRLSPKSSNTAYAARNAAEVPVVMIIRLGETRTP